MAQQRIEPGLRSQSFHFWNRSAGCCSHLFLFLYHPFYVVCCELPSSVTQILVLNEERGVFVVTVCDVSAELS